VYNLESKEQNERSNNASEKDARATIFGAVKRVLSEGDVVVLDGLNYIKGWRYQLYCEAKAMRTGCCVLRVGSSVERAKEVNEERLRRRDAGEELGEEQPYERDCWENLVFRYEEPNGMVRWDSPLFAVVWEDEEPPADAIWEAMVAGGDKKVVVRPNAATVLKPAATGNYLYELDKCTQEIISKILEWAKDHPEGGGDVDVGDGLEVELPGNPLSLPALQRLRRQFIGFNRKEAVPAKRIRETFVGYLNDAFQSAI
jgi:protein KTI12